MSDTKKCIILSSLQGNIMGEKCHSHFADSKTKIPRNLMIGSGNWGSRIRIQVCPSPGPMHLSTLPRFAPDSSLSLFLCPWGTPGGNKAHSTSSHSPSCQSLPLGTFVLLEACFLPWEPGGTMSGGHAPGAPPPSWTASSASPCSRLTPAETASEAPPARLPSASITCLLAFPAWLWGFRWLFLPSGGSPEVSFDLQIGRGNRKMVRDARSLVSIWLILWRRKKKPKSSLKATWGCWWELWIPASARMEVFLFSGTKLEKGLKFPQVRSKFPQAFLNLGTRVIDWIIN